MKYLVCILFIVINSRTSAQTDILEPVNSTADELNPVLTDNGKTLYFIRRFHSENVAGMKDAGDIWVSHFSDSMLWTVPRRLSSPLNNAQFNGIIGFQGEKSNVYLYQHYMPGGKPAKTQGISVSLNMDGRWSTPARIDIKYFYNKSDHVSISLSETGDIMLLSLESYGTYGAEDLYVSFRTGNDQWSEPRNIGSQINTAFQEMTPYLAPDNKTLFFASNGHGGYGGRDIFVTKRQDDSWQNWSEPANLGPEINTTGVELYFQYFPDEERAIYTSTQNSDGYSDLKVVHLPVRKIEEILGDSIETAVLRESVAIAEIRENEPVADKELRITGSVLDAETGRLLQASLLISNENWKESLETEDNGEYAILLPASDVYEVIIKSEGYVSQQEILDIRVSEIDVITHDFTLQPIKVGTTVKLGNVLFVRGSTELLESSYPQLDLVVQMMLKNAGIEIELSGHTDNQGSERLNKILSQQRVDEVINYLIAHGTEKRRLNGKGYGGSIPVASNESEETRKLNRRVEFTIVKK